MRTPPFGLCFDSVLFTLKQETSVPPSFTHYTQDINIQHFICLSPGQEHDSSFFNMKPVFVAWALKAHTVIGFDYVSFPCG